MTRQGQVSLCLPPFAFHRNGAPRGVDPVLAWGSALRAHLGDGAVVQVLFVILALLPRLLLPDRVGVGVFIGVGGDLGQVRLMATALPFVPTRPGHELRIGMRIGAGRGGRVRFAAAHGVKDQGVPPAWPVPLTPGRRFTALQTAI